MAIVSSPIITQRLSVATSSPGTQVGTEVLTTDGGHAVFIIALSAGLIVVAAWIDWRQIQKRKPPVWGLRYMMIFGGGTTVALFILPRLADSAPNQHPLALLTSGAAFIYLWWLATLLFDLAFVWKTYINTTAPSFVRRVSAKLSAAPPPAGPAKD